MLFLTAKDFLLLSPWYKKCIDYRILTCEGKTSWKVSQAALELMAVQKNPYKKRGIQLCF